MDPEATTADRAPRRRPVDAATIAAASAVVVGTLLLVAGWYGVSGEAVVAKQLPYLASATIPGAALLVTGGVALALRWTGRPDGQDGLGPLLELLTEPVTESASANGPDDGGLVALPDGTTYHRAGCPLASGRADAEPVDLHAVAGRGLRPCPVCDPEPPGPGG